VANMIESDYDVAARIIQTELLEYLIVIAKLDDKSREKARLESKRAIEAAEKWQLIKASDRELFERSTNVSTLPKE